ncbi:MAG TPA: hydrogenase expression/formation protein HypE [Armatimonadota bacterium]|nr:hydrogenase expression/formation protein HypE [Armatimonadota bacterium]
MNDDVILLSHGAGGQLMAELIEHVFVAGLDNPILRRREDSGVIQVAGQRLALTTDSFVVTPIIFPGGDIGKLAACGTINDLAASGAGPAALAAAFILEEGVEQSLLRRVVASLRAVADEAGVSVITGDTKVVPRGAADRIFITTTGLGVVPPNVEVSASAARPGDVILINGGLGEHGMAIMCAREGIDLELDLGSDCAPLNRLVGALVEVGCDLHCLRDPTRGGVAAALNEIAEQSQVCIELDEERLPVAPAVRTACELLGLDALQVANEGKMLVILPAPEAERALAAMREAPYGAGATVIGRVLEGPAGRVQLKTAVGPTRIIDLPVGEPMPRIC